MDEKQRILTVLRRTARYFIIIALIISVSACKTMPASTSPQPKTANAKERSLILSRITSWQLSGKIAAITARDSGSASIDWMQRGSQYNISLMGPLGSHAVKLKGRPGLVTLDTAEGKHFSAATPETLLAQQLGWSLPVSYLKYWIRGLPVPGLPHHDILDNNQRLQQLVQGGWNVQFINYENAGIVDLPERIHITSSALKVKIVIYDWKII